MNTDSFEQSFQSLNLSREEGTIVSKVVYKTHPTSQSGDVAEIWAGDRLVRTVRSAKAVWAANLALTDNIPVVDFSPV